ncbi:Solute carrier family 13 member 2 [Portunus trituberculatus]|uniref:Solute carrier family 13 member 2 n=1 Tax=Portunus trituberculatus TaxID=210409 RepID=A0A5B7H581_PORTR|nr:Solute carrier family 13 member 2 [Portunus trituberculatus]
MGVPKTHTEVTAGFSGRTRQSPRLLALGFMIVTSFLSMWISNTATAAMIVPIVDAVVKELTKVILGDRCQKQVED